MPEEQYKRSRRVRVLGRKSAVSLIILILNY